MDQKPPENQQQQSPDSEQSPLVSKIVLNLPADNRKEEKTAQHSEKPENEKDPAKRTLREIVIEQGFMILLTAVIAIANITYTYYARKQWRAMNDQLAVTRHIMEVDQRAWVAVTVSSGNPQVGKSFRLKAQFVNTGKTPAIDARLCAIMDNWGDTETIPEFRDYTDRDCFPGTVMPPVGTGEAKFFIFPIDRAKTNKFELNKFDVQGLVTGNNTLRYYGKVSYADVFGCKHWIKFCYVRVVFVNGDSDWLTCKDGNEIDTDQQCTK